MPVVNNLEGVDRIEGVDDAVEAVQGSGVGRHIGGDFLHEVKRRPAKETENLFPEEEEDSNGNLAGAGGADAILHVDGRRERAAFDFQPWEVPLQLQSAAAELPIDLSACTELDAHDAVHHLDCRCLVARHNVEVGQIHIFGRHLFVDLEEDGWADQHRKQDDDSLLHAAQGRRSPAAAAAAIRLRLT